MNNRHFLIYYDNRTKEITKTIPRTWAKANQAHFPNHDFINTHPTVNKVENYLAQHYGFIIEAYSNYTVLYNSKESIPPSNGLNMLL
jgi:hypothetical protein